MGIVYVSVWALVIGFLSLPLLLFLGKLELWLLSSLGRLLLMKRPNTAAVPIPFIQYTHTWARWWNALFEEVLENCSKYAWFCIFEVHFFSPCSMGENFLWQRGRESIKNFLGQGGVNKVSGRRGGFGLYPSGGEYRYPNPPPSPAHVWAYVFLQQEVLFLLFGLLFSSFSLSSLHSLAISFIFQHQVWISTTFRYLLRCRNSSKIRTFLHKFCWKLSYL